MSNEIIINETNFKKISKRLLKEIKLIDVKNLNLSETQNILSRVFTKKDYNDMEKSFRQIDIQQDQCEENILDPNDFIQEFILNKDFNIAIIEINDGLFSLHYGICHKEIENLIEKYNFLEIHKQILDKDNSIKYLNFINNNLSKIHSAFNIRSKINCSLKINDNGDFLQISNEYNPFQKQNKNFKELYVKSIFDEKENTYKLFISKFSDLDVNKL